MKQNEYIEAAELEKMYMDSLEGLANMHRSNKVHGNIRPGYIGFDSDKNNYMLMENLKDQNLPEKVQIQNLVQKKELYMNPELFKKLEGKQKKQKVDLYQNDNFSLGMSLLAIGNQQTLKDCYNKKTNKFENSVLQKHLGNFENRYKDESPRLVQIANNLLELEGDKRESSTQIFTKCSQPMETKVHATPEDIETP